MARWLEVAYGEVVRGVQACERMVCIQGLGFGQ